MAHIYRDKRGTWYLSIGSGRGRQVRSLGKNERLARLRLGEVNADLERGKAGFPAKGPPLEEMISRHLDEARVNLRLSTYKRYRHFARQWLAFFAGLGLEEPDAVLPAHLERYKAWRLKGGAVSTERIRKKPVTVSRKTVNHELVFIKTIFLKVLGRNPFRAVKALSTEDAKPPRFLTADEARRLIAAANDFLLPYLLGYLYTGARKEELLNLTWEDVDFGRRTIRLPNLKTARTAQEKYRHVPLHPVLRKLLGRRRRLDSPFPKLKWKNSLRVSLIRAAERAGIKGLTRLHDLRHTFASRLAQKGVSLFVIQKLLGHRDSKSTMIYAHLVPETYADAVGLLDFEDEEATPQPPKKT